jgi:hypothetical protein
VPNWPDHVTGDEMVAAMDKVGVDGAIFISANSLYGYDASYAVEVQRAHPDRFAIVKPVVLSICAAWILPPRWWSIHATTVIAHPRRRQFDLVPHCSGSTTRTNHSQPAAVALT